MGLQGSGKTTVANFLTEYLNQQHFLTTKYGIKNTFTKRILDLLESFPEDFQQKVTLGQEKELFRRISTWAEMVDNGIWSDEYVRKVIELLKITNVVITDDIRTSYNIKALDRLSNDYKVILFKLDCPENIRKTRCSAWREENCYTEQETDYECLSKAIIHRIDTSKPIKQTQDEIAYYTTIAIKNK